MTFFFNHTQMFWRGIWPSRSEDFSEVKDVKENL